MNSLLPKRVLCTGGSGFVAHWMARTEPPEVQTFYVKHNDYNDALTYLDMMDVQAIVHLAPVSPARVLRYAQKHGSRVLFASSGAVYDRHDEYSDNKRKWEQECLDSGADVVIARPFCFVGEHLQLDRYAIGGFILDGIAGGPVRYYDTGCIRSYMYGADLGRWMWKILLEGEGVYDVGSSVSVSMRIVAEQVAAYCNCAAVPTLAVEDDKPKIYLPDTARAQELGCVETVTRGEAIWRTIEWNRERINNAK